VKILTLILLFWLAGCAYKFGFSERQLPGGYHEMNVPLFKNETQQVGIEPFFTNALIQRFARSQVAKVSSGDVAPIVLEGTIQRIDTFQGADVTSTSGLPSLPEFSVLSTEYRLVVTAHIVLRRKSDDKIIWSGNFLNEKAYRAPQIGTSLVNSANATYNQNARMNLIARMADEMMVEAHDRITENF
jgi:hypothetical protein